jgi:hypothetical protein
MTGSLTGISRDPRKVNLYRLYLLSLRSAIANGWPKKGFLGHGGLSSRAQERIYQILRSLPFPLPLQSGGQPDIFFHSGSQDLQAVANAVLDATFTLLEEADLERVYRGPIQLLKKHEDGHLVLTTWTSPKVVELLARLTEGLEAVIQVLAA